MPSSQSVPLFTPETGFVPTVRPIPAPGPGEVLIRVGTVGICGSDLSYYTGRSVFPVREPLVLGHEAGGVVAAVGAGSTDLVAGQRVAISPGVSCGECVVCLTGRDNLCESVRYLGSAATTPHVDGALQPYLVMPAANAVPIPDEVSDATAALLEPFGVAHHAVAGRPLRDRSVLVVGGGTIGQLAALIAKAEGATSVVVAELAKQRQEFALNFGATDSLPPDALPAQARFDLVVEATGKPAAFDFALEHVEPGTGQLVLVGNLPADYQLPWRPINRREIGVDSVFRFPGGVGHALEYVRRHGLQLDAFVGAAFGPDELVEAFERQLRPDAPLKTQIRVGEGGS
ncbi:zinc-binding dehydrogenase [Kribbella sp. NPDC004536]|uniref:zinc-dependent alcohol dehydrogenase n=1 Tax=Kribbella sp. NPDC004536 TaxID=3364106 RepID=UPI0036C4B87D